MIKLIKTTGEEIYLKWKELSLDQVRNMIDPGKHCYIESKRIGKTKKRAGEDFVVTFMLMDEDGKMKGLAPNQKATKIFNEHYNSNDIILGNVIITDQLK